jgi:hypothetical protein
MAFSSIRRIALLVDGSEIEYEPGDWRLIRSPDSEILEFLYGTPSVNDTFRVRYTTTWTVDALPSFLEVPSCLLAASFYCSALAAFFGHTSDPTITADVTDYGGRAEGFSRRAKEYLERYQRRLEGLKNLKGAGGIGEWDLKTSWPSQRFLIHGGRGR